MAAHGSACSSFSLKEKLRTTACHVMLGNHVRRNILDLFSIAVGSPEDFSIVAESDLVCVPGEVETLTPDLFPIDQSTYLRLEILDGDERSLLEVCLETRELRAWENVGAHG